MKVSIIGAGMAGLLAGQMLKPHYPTIHEKQDALPNNHSAVLRFRSSIVGDVLGIAFKPVTMVKCSVPWRNPIADALNYSNKCSNISRSDRSLPSVVTTEERFIAPPNLIERMAEGLEIRFGEEIADSALKLNGKLSTSVAVISTMPMPQLMQLLEYNCPPDVNFRSQPGINIRATINECDAYVSLYVPDPGVEFSRVSISGNQLIIEVPGEYPDTNDLWRNEIVDMACYYLGIDPEKVVDATVHKQKYAKILPINDDVRKDFMFWATDKFNIYSLGRFATWRPKLLLDDLVQDIRKITGWAIRNDRYGAARSRA